MHEIHLPAVFMKLHPLSIATFVFAFLNKIEQPLRSDGLGDNFPYLPNSPSFPPKRT